MFNGLDIIPSANLMASGLTLLPPPAKLDAWIQCIWFNDVANPSAGTLKDKFYPDAGASLTFEVSSTDVSVRYLHQAMVLHQQWDLNKSIVSVRLRPGASKALLGLSVSSAQNIDLDLLQESFVHSSSLLSLADSLMMLNQAERVGAILNWFEDLLNVQQKAENPVSSLVAVASSQLLGPVKWAEQVGLSRRTLERKLKNTLGFTPLQLLKFAQIKRARQGLLMPSRAISDIALECGYFDQAHFTNDFHSHIQETPKQYRKRKLSQISNK